MNINIYYGGRGLLEDPALYVLEKIESVLEELHVNVNRYNLFELKNSIITLPQTIKEADAVILAASVEWMGIGGLLTEFLDACWLYGDKEKISNTFMQPVVISTTYGEKDAMMTLKTAWELIGGMVCEGIEAYVSDLLDFKANNDYLAVIEKKTEDLYRNVSKKLVNLPSSVKTFKSKMIKAALNLTPQESEQLSKYVADDIYVKQQKEDIEELTSMFKGLMDEQVTSGNGEFVDDFISHFVGQNDFAASYSFMIEDKNKELFVDIKGNTISCDYDKNREPDVLVKLSHGVLQNIINGRVTFQRAFMTGEMKAKGNFKTLRMLDELFNFE